MGHRGITFAAGVATAIIVLSSCAADDSPGGDTGGDAEISIALGSDPGSLNPLTNATASGLQLLELSYESLVYFEAGVEAAPWLADEWEATTTSVSFTLREGVLCGDGTTLTASDVKATFEYAGADETGSPFKGVLFPVELTVTADDEAGTVVFETPSPDAFLVQKIGHVPIVCASGLEDPSVLETEMHGTGLYALTSATPGTEYTFALRDDHNSGANGVTGETAGLPAVVTAQVVQSGATRANMLQAGELSIGEVGDPDRERLDGAGLYTLDVPSRPGQIFFNQAEGRPTNAFEVRSAIAQALDREPIMQVATGGRGTIRNSLTSPLGSVCIDMDSSAAIPTHDADAAAALLDEAGWVEGADGVRAKDGEVLSLKILANADEAVGVADAIELMRQQLAEVGIQAEATLVSAYTDVIFQGGDWDIVWAPISVELPSPWRGILSGDFPPDGGNWTYNTNQAYFDLADQAAALPGEEGCGLWQAAQDELFSHLEAMPIANSTSTIFGANVEFAVDGNGTVTALSLRVTE